MKKLILAFIILVAATAGGYGLYRFADIFDKSEKTVETAEIEITETVENETKNLE